MKKLFFLLTFLPLSLIGNQAVDDFEQAILDSDLTSARYLSKSISFSATEKKRLMILAEDVLSQRRSFLAYFTPSSNDLKAGLAVLIVGLGCCLQCEIEWPSRNVRIAGIIGILDFFAFCGGCIKHFYDARVWYANAIAIKSLVNKIEATGLETDL